MEENNGNDVLSELEEQNEIEKQRVTLAEQKALEAEAKRRYGADWQKFFSGVHSGIDWQAVKFRVGNNIR